jgi:hypothetical protein
MNYELYIMNYEAVPSAQRGMAQWSERGAKQTNRVPNNLQRYRVPSTFAKGFIK